MYPKTLNGAYDLLESYGTSWDIHPRSKYNTPKESNEKEVPKSKEEEMQGMQFNQ